jgi:hypothetical protein
LGGHKWNTDRICRVFLRNHSAGEPFAHAHTHTDSDPYADPHSYAHGNPDTHTYSNTDA